MKKSTRDLLADLIEATKDWNFDDDISAASKRKCRAIGEQLNELGGYDLMLSVCYAANEKNRSVASGLNFVWDGIGEWRM